jgi:hypothetical protein
LTANFYKDSKIRHNFNYHHLCQKKRDPKTSGNRNAVLRDLGNLTDGADSDEDASVEDDENIESSSISEA